MPWRVRSDPGASEHASGRPRSWAYPSATRRPVADRPSSYPIARVENLVSIIELILYIAAILALSMAVTWAVVKISPSESAKQQKRSDNA